MKRVLTAVVLIPLVLLVVFKAPLWLFALVVGVIIVLALHEYLGIVEAAGIKPFRWLTYAVALLPIVLMWLSQLADHFASGARLYHAYPIDMGLLRGIWVLGILSPVIFGIPLVFRKDLHGGLASVAASALGALYIAGSLLLLIDMRSNEFENILIVFALFSVWAGDIAAYYVGRSIGRHKLAPVVSPNKSWEGASASVIASVLLAILVFQFRGKITGWFSPTSRYWLFPVRAYTFSWTHVILLGLLTNVAAQFGDLFESALKRGANIKDSGSLLPGHGGILDRIDALLFAIPVVWYYANLTGFLRQ